MDDMTRRARELRRSMTEAEHRLWKALRAQSLGAKFRRQVPIGSYVADFACLPKKLIVEVDGGQHLDNSLDAVRDAWLRSRGFRVLRFWDHEVFRNLEGVLETIAGALVGPAGRLSHGEAPPS
jgi:very-short-patch-repair endonuclease